MANYITKRLLQSFIAILGIMVVVFFILHLTGDPVWLMLPPGATQGDYIAMKKALGMDKPLIMQFFDFMWGAFRGDFGQSLRFRGQSALGLVLERFPATLKLAFTSLAISVVISLPLGLISAIKRHSIWDNIVITIALLGQSMPNFWLALMLISIFAVNLNLLPSSGATEPTSIILPAVTLAVFMIARTTRVVRSSLLEVLGEDFVRTARGTGISESRVIIGHALRNAILPIITIIGLDFGTLMGGAVITESVFAWPGVGYLAVGSIYVRDFPVVQAVVFFTALFFVLINLIVDVLYGVLDPRIRVNR